MKKDWKTHPISNIVTFIGILVSLFTVSYCMLFGERYRSFDEKQKEAFCLTCMITVVEKDITNEQAANVLEGYGKLARDYSLNFAGIENLEGQEILSFSDIKEGIKEVSPDDINQVCQKINQGELSFVIRNNTSLQKVYRKLTELCNNNGFEISVNTHREMNERKTAAMEKVLYLLIRCGSILFSTVVLFISLFLWFDIRRHEWFIRNICGQSTQELLLESSKIILLFTLIAYVAVIVLLSFYKPSSAIHIMVYGWIGFCEAVLCMVLLSIKYSNIKR